MTRQILVAILSVSLLTSSTVIAQQTKPANRTVINQYKVNQQRAKDLTADLLKVLVDTQLEQLEDNQLTDIPLYQDLTSMRGRLGDLAMQKMPVVIDLLMQADVAKPNERQDLMKSVHVKMKDVLLDLLREREKLRLRRQHAELIERITEVVVKQTDTREDTVELSTTNEQEILATARSQQDVSLLVTSFDNTLQIVADWSGELGKMATQCAKIIENEDVHSLLVKAETQLGDTEFSNAAGTQKEVIDALEQILNKIRRFEDPAWINADAKEAAENILTAQEEIKEKIESGDLEDEEELNSLVEEQSLIREKLNRLKNALATNEDAVELAERAEEAAAEAREAVFEGDEQEAVELQDEVIGTLAELQEEILNEIDSFKPELSSEEYSKIAEEVAEAREKLEEADELNTEATETAEESTEEAATTEAQAEEAVNEAGENENLPEDVANAIENAAEEVAEATEELQEGSEESEGALDEAGEAISEAIGEAEIAEEEAKKNALAAKVGELNRAVESLERAAAKARDTAESLNEEGSPTEDQVAQAQDDLNKIEEIANDVAEGIKPLSDENVEGLQDAANEAGELSESLPMAAGDEEKEGDAADQADAVAENLENAANELREELLATAEELVKEVQEQLDEVSDLKSEVAMANNPESPATAEQIEDLADRALEEVPSVGEALQEAADAAEQAEAQAENPAQPEDGGDEPPAGDEPAEPNESGDEPADQPEDGGDEPPAGDEPAEPNESGDEPADQPEDGGDEPPAGDEPADGDEPTGDMPMENGQGEPVDPETQRARQLLRAEVLADIKEEILEDELAAAEALKELAEQGQESAEQIAEAREAVAQEQAEAAANAPMNGDMNEGQPMEDPHPSEAEEQLLDAVIDQAEALAGIGELVEALTEQEEIANQPIKDAAQLAATLGPMDTPMDAGDAEPAEGEGAQPGDQPMASTPPAPLPVPDAGNFVPTSPLETAQMMAGKELPLPTDPAQLAENGLPMNGESNGEAPEGPEQANGPPMPGQQPMEGGQPGQGQSQQASEQEPNDMSTFASSQAKGGGTSKGKIGTSENEGPQEGTPEVVQAQTDADSTVPGGRNGDASLQGLPQEKSAFFTSLPKSAREAINSRQNKALPRGYEELLRKYFKNIK
ncbi:MAG: hypothetical protein ACJZ8O_11125 [Pirellulaceae bacterium]